MWWSSRTPEMLPVGSRFRRERQGHFVEHAEVLAVTTATVGIPHVHYKVRFERVTDGQFAEEKRTLALSAFRELYCRPLAVSA